MIYKKYSKILYSFDISYNKHLTLLQNLNQNKDIIIQKILKTGVLVSDILQKNRFNIHNVTVLTVPSIYIDATIYEKFVKISVLKVKDEE
jgi:hypothetical protein